MRVIGEGGLKEALQSAAELFKQPDGRIAIGPNCFKYVVSVKVFAELQRSRFRTSEALEQKVTGLRKNEFLKFTSIMDRQDSAFLIHN